MKSFWSVLAAGVVAAALGAGCLNNSVHEDDEEDGALVFPYGMTTCVVTGDPLEEGEIIPLDFKGRKIPLCCRQCIRDFNKNPEKYVKLFDERIRKLQAAKK